LRNGLPADRADDILLTGVSRHPGGDLGAEIQTGQRRRNERCGDGESCKSSTRTAGVRGGVRWLKISIVRQRLPMRRRDLAWIAVFTDPFARFRRPVSDIKNPTRIILEDDGLLVLGALSIAWRIKTPTLKVLFSEVITGLSLLRCQ
jgi:hypothetical protein